MISIYNMNFNELCAQTTNTKRQTARSFFVYNSVAMRESVCFSISLPHSLTHSAGLCNISELNWIADLKLLSVCVVCMRLNQIRLFGFELQLLHSTTVLYNYIYCFSVFYTKQWVNERLWVVISFVSISCFCKSFSRIATVRSEPEIWIFLTMFEFWWKIKANFYFYSGTSLTTHRKS